VGNVEGLENTNIAAGENADMDTTGFVQDFIIDTNRSMVEL
jgi:hypothetical protein